MFSEKLRLLRQEKHISQEKLAFDINVARQTISKWELGLLDICDIPYVPKNKKDEKRIVELMKKEGLLNG